MTPYDTARAHMAAGQHAKARDILRTALRRDPSNAKMQHQLAQALIELGEVEQAIFAAERAVALAPGVAMGHYTLGVAQGRAGKKDKAVAAFRASLRVDAGFAPAAIDLAALILVEDFCGAGEALGAAAEKAGKDAAAWLEYGNWLGMAGRLEESERALERASRIMPDKAQPAVIGAFYSNASDLKTPEEVAAAHRRVGALLAPRGLPARPKRRDRGIDSRLRLGFMSADYFQHSIVSFFEPLLERLDRGRFSVACYSTGHQKDAVTERLRAKADGWLELFGKDDATLASAVRADGCDVLIEMNGLTEANRQSTLVLRPAPLQITYLGYPNTTGNPAIDARFVDEVTDPPSSEWDARAVERLVRLPGCFLCYKPQAEAPLVQWRPPEERGEGGVVFGSFNAVHKITQTTVRMWAAVLKTVPGSSLLVKAGHLNAPCVESRFRERFIAEGVDPRRVRIAGFVSDRGGHLGLYNQVDIALDTYPYNGTTTTAEALHMGVPVVTRLGDTHAARVSASLLRAAGCDELSAASERAFVGVAADLAADRTRLAAYRTGLRERVVSSRLCDAAAHAAAFGDAVESLWHEVVVVGRA